MVELVATPLHLGPLHPVEQALVFVLAFGPLLLLVLTIWVSRRRSPDEQDAGGRDPGDRNPGDRNPGDRD